MSFRLLIDRLAQQEMEEFAQYTSLFSEEYSQEQIYRLDSILAFELAEHPLRWGYFVLTGAPYRAYLVRAGRHATYWIVYSVDERARIVNILRFWKSSRIPSSFDRLRGNRRDPDVQK